MLRVLFIYLILCALTELLSAILPHFSMMGYFVTQTIFTFLECSLLLAIFYIGFREKRAKQVTVLTYCVFLGFCVYYLCTRKISAHPDSIANIESFILMGLSCYFLFLVQSKLLVPRLVDYPFFWINCSVLIYFSTSIILFLNGDYLNICSRKEFETIWSLHLFANTLCNILYAIGVWRAK